MNMSLRFLARANVATNLRLEQRALEGAEARAARDACQGDDVVAVEQGSYGEIGHVETIVAAEGAKERRELRGDPLAGIVERDAVMAIDELPQDLHLPARSPEDGVRGGERHIVLMKLRRVELSAEEGQIERGRVQQLQRAAERVRRE